jgi:hypothetical protein
MTDRRKLYDELVEKGVMAKIDGALHSARV